MKKNIKKFILATLFFALIFAAILTVYFLIQNNTIIFWQSQSVSIVFLVLLIVISVYYIFLAWKILENKKSKKTVKNLDINKIKDFVPERWMHNEIDNHNTSKEEETLKKFHGSFGCDQEQCYKNKKKKIKKAAWVINTQYRDVKNVAVIPPVKELYQLYSTELGGNILNNKKFEADKLKWEEKIKFKYKELKLVYHTVDATHIIVIGEPGSGKKQKLIIPGIIRNASLDWEEKPIMVINDPEGEIFSKTSGFLEANGYDVKVLNFKDTTSTHSWNPLALSWNYRKEAIEFEKKFTQIKAFTTLNSAQKFLTDEKIEMNSELVKIKCWTHEKSSCLECIEKYIQILINEGYEDGEEIKLYLSYAKFHFSENDFNAKVQNNIKNLKFNSEKELIALASIIIPETTSGVDPFLIDKARLFFIGCATSMLEIMDKNLELLPLKKFNIPNIIKTMIESITQDWVNKYIVEKEKDEENSSGFSWIKIAINSSDRAQKTIIEIVKSAATSYLLSNVESLLCDTENLIDLENICFAEKPTVIYLTVPYDDKSFHSLAACFVDQLYKSAVKTANNNYFIKRTEKEFLTRQLQVYLDEFGNFPKIPSFPGMIPVAGNKNIFFMLILRNYGQLDSVYEKEESKTIKSNCNVSVYIKTNDEETAQKLSEEYGEKIILPTPVPLISSKNISNLDDNFIIVKKAGKNPVLIHSLYSWRINSYESILNHKKAFIPSSNIDFMKDHYFNFMKKEHRELINFDVDNLEKKLWNKLSEQSKNSEQEIDETTLNWDNTTSDDYNKVIYEHILEEQNSYLSEFKRLSNLVSLIETDFLCKKELKKEIQSNYKKLKKLRAEYQKYDAYLIRDLTNRQKEKFNEVYSKLHEVEKNIQSLWDKIRKVSV